MATILINEDQEKSVNFSLTEEEAGILLTVIARFAAGTPVLQDIFEELDDAGVSEYSNVSVYAKAIDPMLELRLAPPPENVLESE